MQLIPNQSNRRPSVQYSLCTGKWSFSCTCRARLKTSLTLASDCPTYMFSNSGPENLSSTLKFKLCHARKQFYKKCQLGLSSC